MIPSTVKSIIIADELIKSVGQFASDELKRQNKKRNDSVELPNVVELNLAKAVAQIKKKGFEVEAILAKNPRKEYAHLTPDVVVKMKPAPTLVNKNFLPGKLIKIYYVNEALIAESQQLKTAYQVKKSEQNQKLMQALDIKKIAKAIPKKKDKK